MEINKKLDWLTEDFIPNLVSVIIPTYNREAYLLEALHSVIAQTYRPIECIVVDDGSTDKTKKRVDSVPAELDETFSIKYIYQSNSGSQVARNAGTQASNGEFIQYLDSDDLLYPEKIEKQVAFMKKHPVCDGVFGDWEKGDTKHKELIISYDSDDMVKQLLTEKVIVNFSFLMRRRIIRKIGEWDVNIKRNQEIDFQVRGLLKGGIYIYQSQSCGFWRVHNAERIANTTGLKEIEFFYHKWEAKLLPLGLFSETIKRNIATVYFWAIHQTVSTRVAKLKILMETIRLYPGIEFINTRKMKVVRRIFGKKNALRIWLLRNKYATQVLPLIQAKLSVHKSVRRWVVKYFNRKVGDNKFCIISNDCWGAEMYKILNRPFNTPFIGLMLMGPCYIKMLEDPRYYLNLPLNFKEQSKYPEMQKIKSGVKFPLAVLGDSGIEIHFLHYNSKLEVKEKWERRLNRMDWDNLFIKYDCGKDYASKELVEKFNKLENSNKLLFGREDLDCENVIVIKEYSFNAVKQFRSCFLSFNPIGWLKGETSYTNLLEKRIGRIAFKYL